VRQSSLHKKGISLAAATVLAVFVVLLLAQAAWAAGPERLFAGWNNGSLGLTFADGAINPIVPEWQWYGPGPTFSPDGRIVYYLQSQIDPAGYSWQLLGRGLLSGATTVVCDATTAPGLFGTEFVGFSGLSNPVTGELYFFGWQQSSQQSALYGLDPSTGAVTTRAQDLGELNGDTLRVSPDGAYMAWTADSDMPPEPDYPKFLICLP
jgi:hypothetical protein